MMSFKVKQPFPSVSLQGLSDKQIPPASGDSVHCICFQGLFHDVVLNCTGSRCEPGLNWLFIDLIRSHTLYVCTHVRVG